MTFSTGPARPSDGSTSLAQDLQYAIELARGAGRIVLEHYGKVETAHQDPRHDQRRSRHRCRPRQPAITSWRACGGGFPDDGIVGEENDTGSSITFDCPDPNGRVWVIDPIDGTNNFIAGLGAFAVCIGLLDQGRPVLGVVLDVTRDLVYSAAAGQGAWLGTRRLHAVATPMSDASMLMVTSNLLDKNGNSPAWAARWIGQTNWKVRMLGSAALEACQVAAGVAHGAGDGQRQAVGRGRPCGTGAGSRRRPDRSHRKTDLSIQPRRLQRSQSPIPCRRSSCTCGASGRDQLVMPGAFR